MAAEKGRNRLDKGKKDRSENIKLYCQSFKRLFEFKGKNIVTISLCLIPLPSIFEGYVTYWRTILNSNPSYFLLICRYKCNNLGSDSKKLIQQIMS